MSDGLGFFWTGQPILPESDLTKWGSQHLGLCVGDWYQYEGGLEERDMG